MFRIVSSLHVALSFGDVTIPAHPETIEVDVVPGGEAFDTNYVKTGLVRVERVEKKSVPERRTHVERPARQAPPRDESDS